MQTMKSLNNAEKVNQYVDEIFWNGADYTMAQIAYKVGCSESFVRSQYEMRLGYLREEKALQEIEFPAREMHGRVERINGKMYHVYESRMNQL